MITSKEINPKNSLYYIGGLILHELADDDTGTEFFDLYDLVNKKHEVSLKLFILALDWLFLIDLIDTVKPRRWGSPNRKRRQANQRYTSKNVPRKTKSRLRRTADQEY